MRHFCMVLLAGALLAGCTSETKPVGVDETADQALVATDGIAAAQKATTSTTRTTGSLDVTLHAACVGEDVRLHGPVAIRIRTTVDGRGRPHQVAYYDWGDVVATGQTSGNTWHTTAAVEVYTLFNYEPVEPHQPSPNRNPLGEPAVFHHTGAIRLQSDSDAPDLYTRHLVQTVINANGDVRVDTDLLELLECR